jgi:CheY-like chemotaxis protein
MTTILVVDDEPAIREVLLAMLEDEGYRVATASNGIEGLARIEEVQPDLVILDRMMPMLDGEGVLERMHADPSASHVPIIMMSALSSPLTREQRAKIASFFQKPFSMDALLSEIRRLTQAPV